MTEEPRDNNRDECRRWLAEEEDDVGAGQASADAGRYSWACFQAQQAAEKALKAYLFWEGHRILPTHAIGELLNMCRRYNPDFGQLQAVAELDRYYIPTRYPNGLPEPERPATHYSEKDAQRCLGLARSSVEFVKSLTQS